MLRTRPRGRPVSRRGCLVSPRRPQPGDMVRFSCRNGFCVGYVDSIGRSGHAANVTAVPIEVGRWQREGNPSLSVFNYIVVFEDLEILAPIGGSR